MKEKTYYMREFGMKDINMFSYMIFASVNRKQPHRNFAQRINKSNQTLTTNQYVSTKDTLNMV